jgi:Mrp family chromosome partitioning ATPase
VLTAGAVPPNPAELLTSPRFKEVLDRLAAEYDFVLVDTPPLLAVTDPAVVAPRVDGVLLVVRLRKNGRPNAERAMELLWALEAQVLGVVVNGVNPKNRFGSYAYRSYGCGADAAAYHNGAAETAHAQQPTNDAQGKPKAVNQPARDTLVDQQHPRDESISWPQESAQVPG